MIFETLQTLVTLPINWLTIIALVLIVLWLYLFIAYTIGIKEKPDIGLYFRAMFKAFNNSRLRIGWKSLILGIEYLLGLIIGAFIKSAWYVSQWVKKFIRFIFLNPSDPLDPSNLSKKR